MRVKSGATRAFVRARIKSLLLCSATCVRGATRRARTRARDCESTTHLSVCIKHKVECELLRGDVWIMCALEQGANGKTRGCAACIGAAHALNHTNPVVRANYVGVPH